MSHTNGVFSIQLPIPSFGHKFSSPFFFISRQFSAIQFIPKCQCQPTKQSDHKNTAAVLVILWGHKQHKRQTSVAGKLVRKRHHFREEIWREVAFYPMIREEWKQEEKGVVILLFFATMNSPFPLPPPPSASFFLPLFFHHSSYPPFAPQFSFIQSNPILNSPSTIFSTTIKIRLHPFYILSSIPFLPSLRAHSELAHFPSSFFSFFIPSIASSSIVQLRIPSFYRIPCPPHSSLPQQNPFFPILLPKIPLNPPQILKHFSPYVFIHALPPFSADSPFPYWACPFLKCSPAHPPFNCCLPNKSPRMAFTSSPSQIPFIFLPNSIHFVPPPIRNHFPLIITLICP